MSKIADKVTELAEPIVKDFGCTLYKVKYLKEGPDYYLRVFIEKESGVGINDCERYKVKYSDFDDDFKAWLEEHCWEYGFIQRYPSKKCLRTGWDEPWHYRYVGKEVAKFIMDNGICYEEFYEHYSDK